MKARTAYFAWVLISMFLLCTATATPQGTPTYALDPNFNTGNLFRDGSGITSLVLYEDGRILAGGGFSPFEFWSPFKGFGIVWADGSEYSDWEGAQAFTVSDILVQDDGILYTTTNGIAKLTPQGEYWYYAFGEYWGDYLGLFQSAYNVANIWCMKEQSDGRILIGGAVATDTTQPNLYRNLMRVLPDGSHDTTFPPIEIEPNIPFTKIREIHRDSHGRWIVSGDFWAVNGHQTAYVARLNQDFSVDTGFVSPLQYVFSLPEPVVKLFDSQDRMWMSGHLMVTYDNPLDTINILRILPSGEADTTFLPRRVEEVYPPEISSGGKATQLYGGLELGSSNHYVLYGKFNYFNDTLQPCITMVDDAGTIQHNYFQGDGATEHHFFGDHHLYPYVGAVAELSDGSLIVGGAFSEFMGATHYNMVKLNRGTIGTRDRGETLPLSVHPNPAADHFRVSAPGVPAAEVYVHDLSGRILYRDVLTGETLRIPTSDFAPGVYLVYVRTERATAVGKVVVGDNR